MAQNTPGVQLVLGLLVGLAVGGFLFQAPRSGLELPTGAVSVGACVPGVGEKFAAPADEPFGPYYLTDAGDPIGVEYRVPDLSLPGENVLGPAAPSNATLLGVNFPVAFSRVRFSQGDDALNASHAVIQLYAITEEDLAGVACAKSK